MKTFSAHLLWITLIAASPAYAREPWDPPCSPHKNVQVQTGGQNHDLVQVQWLHYTNSQSSTVEDGIRDGGLSCAQVTSLNRSATVISGIHRDILNLYGASDRLVIAYYPWRDGPVIIKDSKEVRRARDPYDTFMTVHGIHADLKQRFCWHPRTARWYRSEFTTDGSEPLTCTSPVETSKIIKPRA